MRQGIDNTSVVKHTRVIQHPVFLKCKKIYQTFKTFWDSLSQSRVENFKTECLNTPVSNYRSHY